MKVEFKAKAYLSAYQTLPDVIEGKTLPLISPTFSTYYTEQGYPCIGDVTLTIELDPEDVILDSQRETLRAKLVAAREEYERNAAGIISAIGKL